MGIIATSRVQETLQLLLREIAENQDDILLKLKKKSSVQLSSVQIPITSEAIPKPVDRTGEML